MQYALYEVEHLEHPIISQLRAIEGVKIHPNWFQTFEVHLATKNSKWTQNYTYLRQQHATPVHVICTYICSDHTIFAGVIDQNLQNQRD